MLLQERRYDFVHCYMGRKCLTRVPVYFTPTPAMDDLDPRFETSNFHNDASNIGNQGRQIVISGGQHIYL